MSSCAPVECLEARYLLFAVPELIADINQTTDYIHPNNFQDVGGFALFGGRFSTNDGSELWRTDGTPDGSYRIKDLNPGTDESLPSQFTRINSVVLFAARSAESGRELWRTDGTEAGTTLLKDINPGPADGAPFRLTRVGEYVYFTANNGTNGTELWRSDGTAEGTVAVRSLAAGDFRTPNSLINFNGKLLFNANGQLGLFDGVNPLKIIGSGVDPKLLVEMGGNAYFVNGSISTGYSFCKTDGATTITKLATPLLSGQTNLGLGSLTASGNLIYFGADFSGGYSDQLWRSDGTAAGTFVVSNRLVYPAAGQLCPIGQRSALYIERTATTSESWVTDGTLAGTRRLYDFGGDFAGAYSLVAGQAYVFPHRDNQDTELWKTDGTPDGTRFVKNVDEAGQSI